MRSLVLSLALALGLATVAAAAALMPPLHATPAAPDAAERPAPAPPASAEKDVCAGRNPIHCAKPSVTEDGRSILLAPPGGCAGRNPLYCQEEAPVLEEEPERRPRERANPRSKNPRRNPRSGGD